MKDSVESQRKELAGPARFEQISHEHIGIHVGKVNSETLNRRFLNECLGLRVNAEARKDEYVIPVGRLPSVRPRESGWASLARVEGQSFHE